ncbi:MAG: phosphoadenosine phosphosulfate reductase family protein [Candidatus Thiothrix moscowensis]|nr:phosphoadenosine phosphosulfate reductase family protein [Candidatus Thiothrix moscowensis]
MSNTNILSISGGKDSTAMLLLALERGVAFRAVFADTGNEHQAVYDYLPYLEQQTGVKIEHVKADFTAEISRKRDYAQTVWQEEGIAASIIADALSVLYPTGNPFLDLCLWKGRFPSRMAQFCTEELKRNPVLEQVILPALENGTVESWQGVRADESAKRAKYTERTDQGGGLTIYRPILTWTVQDVFAIHRKHGIQPNPLYLQGMGRVGCMPCINAGKAELAEIAQRFPAEVARIREWERLVGMASKRGASTFFAPDKDSQNHVAGIDTVMQWAKTERGGKVYSLFSQPAMYTGGCASAYGLCDGGTV